MGPAARRKTLARALLAVFTIFGAAACSKKATDAEHFELRSEVPGSGRGFALALQQTTGELMLPGNRVEVVNNGEVFDVLARELEGARSSIHILMYIWDEGAASEKLIPTIAARARAGVACRIMVDLIGSGSYREELRETLSPAGCDVRVFRPSHKDDAARNHRKLVIIDGRTGLTGGLGIRDDWLGDGTGEDQWRDTNVLVRGPAVAGMQQAFAENWIETTGTLLPAAAFPALEHVGTSTAVLVSSTGSPHAARAERLVLTMIAAAKRRLWIANAYFVPSSVIAQALRAKAKAGVDVRVLTAGASSDSKISFAAQRAEYPSFIEHGVRIWEYRTTMMHAKTMIIDEELSMIGSINLEPLSLGMLEEASLVIEDRAIAARLARDFAADLGRSEERDDD